MSRPLPPMPSNLAVLGTVRDTGNQELVVARVVLADVEGEQREFDLNGTLALVLMVQLANWLGQVGVWP